MGQQQDAHEFFVFLLDGLHEELAKYSESVDVTVESDEDDEAGQEGGEGDDGEWSEVGPGNRTSITRQTKHKETPIRCARPPPDERAKRLSNGYVTAA